MTWSYSGNPSSSDKDKVRFTIGDTDSTEPLLQDEEIQYLLDENSSVDEASVYACYAIAAKFSRLADRAGGKVSITYSQISKQYLELANRLYAKRGILAVPYAGGLDKTEKDVLNQDPNATQPAFKRNMMQYEGMGNLTKGI